VFLKHGIGHAFDCLGWHCPATFIIFLPRPLTLCVLEPRNTWCGNPCFREQESSKFGTWYSKRVILQFLCVGCWAGVTYLRYTVLTSSNKSETAVHCCDPAVSVPLMLVSRNVFSCSISLVVIVSITTTYRIKIQSTDYRSFKAAFVKFPVVSSIIECSGQTIPHFTISGIFLSL